MNKLYTEITDRIVAALKAGTAPWSRPWSQIVGSGMPRNAITKRAYSGVNVLLLWATAQANGYASNDWLTYKQAQAVGAQVRKSTPSPRRARSAAVAPINQSEEKAG